MNSLLWSSSLAFLLAVFLTPILRNVSRLYGVVDIPDNGRKIHVRPIPRVGGCAIAASYFGACVLASYLPYVNPGRGFDLVWRLLPGTAVVFSVGIIDDLFGLNAVQKLFGQFAGATLACLAGFRISFISSGDAGVDWLSYPVTILWLLLCINAFNLVDGLDGLAGGIGVCSAITIFLASVLRGNADIAVATLPLAACLIGFLSYNFTPASIFLGDSGSLLIGFVLGVFGIEWARNSSTIGGKLAPLIALSVPLLDTGLCIVRRTLRQQSIFAADRCHIHHKLLDRGLSPRQAVLAIYGICVVMSGLALLASREASRSSAILSAVVLVAVAAIGIRYLDYDELAVIAKVLFKRGFRQSLRMEIELRTFEKALSSAETFEHCWTLLDKTAEHCGMTCERLVIDSDLEFGDSDYAVDGTEVWRVRVPILNSGLVEFRSSLSSHASAAVIGSFVEVIHGSLAPRLRELRGQVDVSIVSEPAEMVSVSAS
jgi:UDP-GlcNAc:undecaprenyl-phosphate GlcNAc-1-phosphate transferase